MYVEYNQRSYRGSSVSTNIIEASTQALLEVVNRIEHRRRPARRSREERTGARSGQPQSRRSRSSMPIPATPFIWFNGKLVPWEKATVHVLAHALHYGSSVFEGVRAYETPAGRGDLPPARSHAAPVRLGEDLPHPRCPSRPSRSTRPAARSSPPTACAAAPTCARSCSAATARSAWCPKIEPPVEVAIAAWEWGKYLGRGERGAGRRCLRLLLAARGAEHPAGAGQGRRQLSVEPADRRGSRAPRLRRRHRPVGRRHGERRRGREPVPGQGRRAAHARPSPTRCSAASRATRVMRWRASAASRCARARSRASCCTSPTRCS